MQLQRSEGLMLFIGLVMTAFIFIAVAGQHFIPALPYIEVGGSLGWNWFSVLCISFMATFSIWKAGKILSPITSKKIPLMISMAAFPLLFYYSLIDMLPRMFSVIAFNGMRNIGISQFISNYLIYITIYNPLPSNFIAFIIYAVFTVILAGKYLDTRPVAAVFFMTFIFNLAALIAFGDFNARLLPESERVIAYYSTVIPGWIVTTIGYVMFWRKKK